MTSSSVIDPTRNHLMLARQGTALRLYANGQQLAVATDATGTAGTVALYAEARANGLDARFDNFRLYRVR